MVGSARGESERDDAGPDAGLPADPDVVVVGGGAAGLAAATALARSRRSVVVVDAGQPRNSPAEGVHNYLGREGTPPGELLAIGRAELQGYGGGVVEGTVTAVRQEEGHTPSFRVELADGRVFRARRLLAAPGAGDELPDVPGIAQRWGRDVLHCPYCHGHEVRDRRIAVLSSGPMTGHQAQLFRQLSDDVRVLLHEQPAPTGDEAARLAARNISLVPGRVTGLEVVNDRLTGVRLESGELVECDALVVAPIVRARVDFLAPLGLVAAEVEIDGRSVGSAVAVAPTGATTVPGVFVVGNATDVSAQVVVSAAAGMRAGAFVNADLVEEEIRLAVESVGRAA